MSSENFSFSKYVIYEIIIALSFSVEIIPEMCVCIFINIKEIFTKVFP